MTPQEIRRFAPLVKIVSGGQTGADRAALDWAIDNGIPHGGWCPRGRLAEDGRIPDRYQLSQTASRKYAVRTEWNARDSDGTLVFSIDPIVTGGTELTLAMARKHGKPRLHIHRQLPAIEACDAVDRFLIENGIAILNIGGPRASNESEVGNFVRDILDRWRDLRLADD